MYNIDTKAKSYDDIIKKICDTYDLRYSEAAFLLEQMFFNDNFNDNLNEFIVTIKMNQDTDDYKKFINNIKIHDLKTTCNNQVKQNPLLEKYSHSNIWKMYI